MAKGSLKDTIVDAFRSPVVRANLIEQLNAWDAKGAAEQFYRHLDIFLSDKDMRVVIQAIKNKAIEFIRALDALITKGEKNGKRV